LSIAKGSDYIEFTPQDFMYMEYEPSCAKYDEKNRRLDVDVCTSNILLGAPAGQLQGTVTYHFYGELSPDGDRWYAQVSTEGGFGGVMTDDPNAATRESLLFQKFKN
jgi:hypothetical protein